VDSDGEVPTDVQAARRPARAATTRIFMISPIRGRGGRPVRSAKSVPTNSYASGLHLWPDPGG